MKMKPPLYTVLANARAVVVDFGVGVPVDSCQTSDNYEDCGCIICHVSARMKPNPKEHVSSVNAHSSVIGYVLMVEPETGIAGGKSKKMTSITANAATTEFASHPSQLGNLKDRSSGKYRESLF